MPRRPGFRPALFFLLLGGLWFPAMAQETVASTDALIATARAQRLHEDPYWRVLLHYRPRLTGGWKSLIDDPRFFNAPDGRTNPEAELAATLRALLSPFDPGPDGDETSPACRFPARLVWLRDRLAIDPERLPPCEDYERVRAHLKPASVTLVFPAAYMNSPASMFGHTLIVFDGEDQNRLLSKGVGYAAAVTTGIGPVFALKGILGLYPGRFAVENYADKVETYNDIHRRDVWEYELDFSRDEVDRMFRHAWELQNIWSWYYFFDENCAYKLYQLIDAARPGLNLSDEQPAFVIPIDMVKLVSDRGLVRSVYYRPSKSVRMEALADSLPAALRARALEVGAGRAGPDVLLGLAASPVEERRALDLAADYTHFLYTSERIDRDAYGPRLLELLKARSRLGVREVEDVVLPEPARPELGHAAALVAPGLGAQNGEGFVSLSGRVAYHDLLDHDAGFTRGAQILFLPTEVRWVPDRDRIELRSIDLVHVESIAPRNDLFTPVSWRVRMGASQMDRRDGDNGLVGLVQTGGGGAWDVTRAARVFALLESEIQGSERYREKVAGGPGVSVGWLHGYGKGWKSLVRARAVWLLEGAGEDFWRFEGSIGIDRTLAREWSVRAGYRYTRNDAYDIHEPEIALRHTF